LEASIIECDGESLWGRTEQRRFGPCQGRNFTLNGWYMVGSKRPGDWNLVRDVSLIDVTQINAFLNTAAIEDVALHNLKRQGASPLFLWGCVFKRVKLSGALSGIKINRSAGPLHPDQQEWDAAIVAYYKTVDWALDISESKFKGGCSFEAIPGNLIKRNPETQVLVNRDRLEGGNWEHLDYAGTAIDIGLSWFLSGSLFDSVVLAARSEPKWAKRDFGSPQFVSVGRHR
jgi:hypothetical protein